MALLRFGLMLATIDEEIVGFLVVTVLNEPRDLRCTAVCLC